MTKGEIIVAAFRVWGRNFYRKTSLSQLAGELKVSKTALYRHFRSKHALIDAMIDSFLNDFSVSIKGGFENAHNASDPDDGIFAIIGSISGYFARNGYSLIFSLINIYDRNIDGNAVSERLKTMGADMGALQVIAEKKYDIDPTVIRLIFATLTFFMSHFHKANNFMETPPAGGEIEKITNKICETIKLGLKFPAEKTELDFEKLEKAVEGMALNAQPEPFFKAVAEAVAQAGPWDVSMDMVAKRLGLSKSSLYGHFKNRKDMLRRLFLTEFKRIIAFAKQGISLLKNNCGLSGGAEQLGSAVQHSCTSELYLGIYSITVYLRLRPEILTAMDWIRTRKLDFGKPDKNLEIFRLFEDINIEPMHNAAEEEKQNISHWIMFLLINILINPFNQKIAASNKDIHILYKFITLGLGGFCK